MMQYMFCDWLILLSIMSPRSIHAFTYCTILSSLNDDFPGGSDGKVSAYNAGDPGSQSLGWEDLLKKEMATRSSILAWKIPWAEEPGRLQYMGLQRIGHD